MNKKNEGKTLPDKMLVNKPATIIIFILLSCLSVYNTYLTYILTFVELINDIYKLNKKISINILESYFIKLTSYFLV